jgi:hypothetical protein
MRLSFSLVATVALVACSAVEEDADLGEANDELQSAPLPNGDWQRIRAPAGMPAPWAQPDTTGFFDQHGKCGPTAVANTLKLYGLDVSPAQADHDGVHSLVGTSGIKIESYLQEKYPRLGCILEHPQDGLAFLRSHLDAGQPVMVWFNMAGGFLGSHWATVVGHRRSRGAEVAIVMSWGEYYTIPMSHLEAAWENVYGYRRPSVVCKAQTKLIAH